jgi:hypothetical protein
MRTLRAMLDGSLEIVIGFARLLTVLALLVTFGCLAWWVWYGDARYGGLAALALALSAASGWFGFWLFGNEEWRRGKTVDGPTAVRHD